MTPHRIVLSIVVAAAIAVLWLPLALAADRVLGYVQTSDGRIDLFEQPGPCVGKARRAEFVPSAAGEPIAGCWVAGIREGRPTVVVLFFDGDIASLPVAHIQRPKDS